MTRSDSVFTKSKSPDEASRKMPIQTGVITIPITPEILALKIAPEMFPRAMETITTDEETVPGKADRKKTASHSCRYSEFRNRG